MATSTGNFETFFTNWLSRQEALLQQLLLSAAPQNVDNTEQHLSLIAQVFSHYKVYYEEKLHAATCTQDTFVFMNPPWLTSLEKSILWLGDFKPGVLFKLLSRSVTDLTRDQSQRIEQVKAVTMRAEKVLTETMAAIQESMASPPILNLTRRVGRLINGEVSEIEVAAEMLKSGVLSVLAGADELRGWTAAQVVRALSSLQAARFLAAALEFQLQIRRLGQRRDEQRLQ